jgi:hypothetical protein
MQFDKYGDSRVYLTPKSPLHARRGDLIAACLPVSSLAAGGQRVGQTTQTAISQSAPSIRRSAPNSSTTFSGRAEYPIKPTRHTLPASSPKPPAISML